MAGNSIRVNTDQVAQTAAKMEALNRRLAEVLADSRSTVEGLTAVWSGEAANATVAAYREFAGKYFEQYEEVIEQYVQFLRLNVDQGYFETETQNVKAAEVLR